jgi:hypothetical protein
MKTLIYTLLACFVVVWGARRILFWIDERRRNRGYMPDYWDMDEYKDNDS